MPIFNISGTNKDAIWVSESKHCEDAIEIKEPFDLPPMAIWNQVDVPPEITAHGFEHLDGYLRAFFKATVKVYYVWIFKSAFAEEAKP